VIRKQYYIYIASNNTTQNQDADQAGTNQTGISQAKWLLILVSVLAIGLSLFQLYTAGIKNLGAYYLRGIHLSVILTLVFLLFPAFGKNRKRGVIVR